MALVNWPQGILNLALADGACVAGLGLQESEPHIVAGKGKIDNGPLIIPARLVKADCSAFHAVDASSAIAIAEEMRNTSGARLRLQPVLASSEMKSWSQVAFSVCQHVPGERRNLLGSQSRFDRQQEDREVARGIAGLLQGSPVVNVI